MTIFPVLSWLVLRGSCRQCHAPISPLPRGGTGRRAVSSRAGRPHGLRLGAAGIPRLSGRAPGSFVHRPRTPDPAEENRLSVAGHRYPLLLLASGATTRLASSRVGAICGAAWFVLFFAMNFASPRILGFGDVRLAPLLGLALGWLGWRYVVLGFFAANFIGLVIGLALIAAQTDEARTAHSLWNLSRRGRGARDLSRDPRS